MLERFLRKPTPKSVQVQMFPDQVSHEEVAANR